MKKAVILMLALCLIITCFCGCEESKTDQEKASQESLLIGSWEAQIDYAEILNVTHYDDKQMASVDGAQKYSEFKLDMVYTFRDGYQGGTYTMEPTQESYNKAVIKFREEVANNLKKQCRTICNQTGTTEDELLKGETYEQLANRYASDATINDLAGTFRSSGTYTVDGDRLTLTSTDDSVFREVVVFEIKQDTLIFKESVDATDGISEAKRVIYPISFNRAK